MSISAPFLWHWPKSDLLYLFAGLYCTKSPLTSQKTLYFHLPACFINQNLIFSKLPDAPWAKTPNHQDSWWQWGRSKVDLNSIFFKIRYLFYFLIQSIKLLCYISLTVDKVHIDKLMFYTFMRSSRLKHPKTNSILVRAGSVIKTRCRLEEDVHMLLNWQPGLLQGEQLPWAGLKLSLNRVCGSRCGWSPQMGWLTQISSLWDN